LLDLEGCTNCGRCQDACRRTSQENRFHPGDMTQNLKDDICDMKAPHSLPRPRTSGNLKPSWKDGVERMNSGPAPPVWPAKKPARSMWSRSGERRASKVPRPCRNEVHPRCQAGLQEYAEQRQPLGTAAQHTDGMDQGPGHQEIYRGNRSELLFWVGCAGSFDARSQKVAATLVKILQACGIRFGILGTAEGCCGDSARRMGNEYLFITLAEAILKP